MSESANPGRAGGWLAGVAEVDITPPLGVDMTGYAGRPGAADHILDRLHVRALALGREGEEPVVLTGADLLGISTTTVDRIRELAAPWVRPWRLLLNHSHTHAGPTTAPLRAMGAVDGAYLDLVARWTVTAVRQALASMRPASLAFGTALTQIGLNRRELREGRIVLGENTEGAYDPTVCVFRVDDSEGRPLACWFSHATHPVVMGPPNTGISAEWPGVSASTLQAALGCPAVFAQGCCGDINPVRRGEYDVVGSVGQELAGSALIAWERAEPVEGTTLDGVLLGVYMPQRLPSVEEAQEAVEQAESRLKAAEAQARSEADPPTETVSRRRIDPARAAVEWANDYLKVARSGEAPPVRMDVQALGIGDVVIVGTGAETFIEIGQEIQRRSPSPRAVALGYTNGCFGYLPTEKAFPKGGYEVDGAYRYYGTLMVRSECELITLDASERVLADLWR